MCNNSNENISFNIGNINIKNNQVNNQFLNNLKEYFSYKDKNINLNINNINNIIKNNEVYEPYEPYEPFDLNCIFAIPRKNIKEIIMNILEKKKLKIKQINPYKYNIIYRGKKEIIEFCLNINNKGILKIKKIKGNYNEYINIIRKIIYNVNVNK